MIPDDNILFDKYATSSGWRSTGQWMTFSNRKKALWDRGLANKSPDVQDCEVGIDHIHLILHLIALDRHGFLEEGRSVIGVQPTTTTTQEGQHKQENQDQSSGAFGALSSVLSGQQKGEGSQSNSQASGLMGLVNNAMVSLTGSMEATKFLTRRRVAEALERQKRVSF
ncbi:hypothetical protein FRC19_008998 [Serendipita sp. 401]|nr:hypothetical protein FRC19_008998 [Serendipita sp. 401]